MPFATALANRLSQGVDRRTSELIGRRQQQQQLDQRLAEGQAIFEQGQQQIRQAQPLQEELIRRNLRIKFEAQKELEKIAGEKKLEIDPAWIPAITEGMTDEGKAVIQGLLPQIKTEKQAADFKKFLSLASDVLAKVQKRQKDDPEFQKELAYQKRKGTEQASTEGTRERSVIPTRPSRPKGSALIADKDGKTVTKEGKAALKARETSIKKLITLRKSQLKSEVEGKVGAEKLAIEKRYGDEIKALESELEQIIMGELTSEKAPSQGKKSDIGSMIRDLNKTMPEAIKALKSAQEKVRR